MVVGLPGLFGDLTIDSQTMAIGLPVLIMATALFIFSGISRRIHVQEGTLYLLLYVIFTAKLFGLF
jgi:Ca2+/Na+ antiporter